ncbi:trypsin-like peptidase domain-containing protein [Deinococcus sp.]|uniref:trypsin-like peptidase domain-containing protein n=1 Tax=Deinococcus sp. TaxID=47478 RepID=UPI003C7D65C0
MGDSVFAPGRPWGRAWTLTRGVNSGLGHASLGAERAGAYLRSDVQLAPGNSGSPLLNAAGEESGATAWSGWGRARRGGADLDCGGLDRHAEPRPPGGSRPPGSGAGRLKRRRRARTAPP